MTIDVFTVKRLERFIEGFRAKSGQLPTLQDFENGGFERSLIDRLVREKVISQFYVTLTNGSIVKGFKISQPE